MLLITILILLNVCNDPVMCRSRSPPWLYTNKKLTQHSLSMQYGMHKFKKEHNPLADTNMGEDLKMDANEKQLGSVTDNYSSVKRTNRQEQHRRVQRSAVRNRTALWPNGIVPYVISSQYTTRSRAIIAAAFQEIHQKTVVRFVPRTNEEDYLHIWPADGCYTDGIGRKGGEQTVSLDGGCFQHRTILHGLVEALGFFHEHTRYDRDDYVRIVWRNITPGMEKHFFKRHPSTMLILTPYDYESVMHDTGFFMEGTIVPLQPGVKIGQGRHLSRGDVKRINLLYEPYTIFDPLPSATTANTPPIHSERQWTQPPSATTEISPPMQSDRQWACGWESSDGNSSPLWTCKWVRTQNYTPEEIPYKII